MSIPAKYYFSVDCDLATEVIGEFSDGIRYHIDYGGGVTNTVSTDSSLYKGSWLEKITDADVTSIVAGLPKTEQERFEAKLKTSALPTATKIDVAPAHKALALAKTADEAEPRGGAKKVALQQAVQKADADLATQLGPTVKLLAAVRSSAITTRPPTLFPGLEWFGIAGKVLSGADLAVVRRDGVAIFDARVTFEAEDGFRVHGIFSGALDFGPKAYANFPSPSAALSAKRDVRLAVRFEAADDPPSFAAQRYKDHAVGTWKYTTLTRGQFVALGTVKFKNEKFVPADNIKFDVYGI